MPTDVPFKLDATILQAEMDRLYRIHVNAFCDDDCCHCDELRLGNKKHYNDELRRIEKIKAKRRGFKPNPAKPSSPMQPIAKTPKKRKKAKGARVDASDLPAQSSQRGNRGKGWLY